MGKRAIALALLGLASCGGGDSTPNAAGVERSEAQKQCDSVMSLWCDGSLECVQAGLPPEEMLSESELDDESELCLDVARRTCDGTLSVNDGFDACQASVETISDADCEAIRTALAADDDEAVVSMPASCIGLFNGL